MTELYPTNIRGTGQGFCYNAGRAIGSVLFLASDEASFITGTELVIDGGFIAQ